MRRLPTSGAGLARPDDGRRRDSPRRLAVVLAVVLVGCLGPADGGSDGGPEAEREATVDFTIHNTGEKELVIAHRVAVENATVDEREATIPPDGEYTTTVAVPLRWTGYNITVLATGSDDPPRTSAPTYRYATHAAYDPSTCQGPEVNMTVQGEAAYTADRDPTGSVVLADGLRGSVGLRVCV